MTAQDRPVIGVTSYREFATMGAFATDAVYLPATYMDAVVDAGGAVVILPPQRLDTASIVRVLDGLDGLLISGGYDVDPALYGQVAHRDTDQPRRVRDEWELALLEGAMKRDLPVLGICRGAQVLNVLRGGTLHQHLPDVVGSTRHQGSDGAFASVTVEALEGSLLSSVHDHTREVPVYHHQAIDDLGEGLVVNALSDDGIIEGIEAPGYAFCVATQWHPEMDTGAARLFEAFVTAARDYREGPR